MLVLPFILVFILGACAGVVINYCADRLPYEKSLFWPAPRCSACLGRLRWYDQVPILSYLVLAGRCRMCRARLPARYLLVELGTALAFLGLFWGEVVQNFLGLPAIERARPVLAVGQFPPALWWAFGHHALLVALLILVSVCDLEHLEIPLGITVFGTILGLIFAVLLPWPFPEPAPRGALPLVGGPRVFGAYPWPVWWPLPAWMPPASWQLGLATGLAGAAMGALMLRGVRFLFGLGRGIEGLGLGDADLMMMAGSFLGWQPILLGFFAGVFPALGFGLLQLARRGDQPMPFGPSLAIGVLIVLFNWPALARHLEPLLDHPELLGFLFFLGAVFLLLTSFMLRLVRGRAA